MQDLSMNPQKLAGQCAKLKCCLNFEIDAYAEASKQLPQKDIILQTKDADYYLFKTDILTRTLTYSTDKRMGANLTVIPASRAFEIIALNKQGIKPDRLAEDAEEHEARREYIDLTDQDALTRFDKAKKKKKSKGAQTTQSPKGGGQQPAKLPPQPPKGGGAQSHKGQAPQPQKGVGAQTPNRSGEAADQPKSVNDQGSARKSGSQRRHKRHQQNKDQKTSNSNTETHDSKKPEGQTD